jgi:ABC-type multidrug transport system fused ATPase/permease subunit
LKFIAWPSPLRKTHRAPLLTDRNIPKTLLGFVWKVSAGDQNSTMDLRTLINDLSHREGTHPVDAKAHGTEISMIISECDAVGGFVGDSISEPLLQAGTMVSVISYLVYLQPLMVFIIAAVLLPQFVFVPLMQLSINKKARTRIATLRAASAEIVGDQVDSDEMLLSQHQHQRFSRVFALNIGIYRLKFSMNFLMNLTHQLGVALILCAGGWFVVNGKTQIGTVVVFISGLATVKVLRARSAPPPNNLVANAPRGPSESW